MNLEKLSDILVGAHKAALRRQGSTIELGDVAAAIVELQSVKDVLMQRGLAASDLQEEAAKDLTGILTLRQSNLTSHEVVPSPQLLAVLDGMPEDVSRTFALLTLWDIAQEAGRASFTAAFGTAVKDALRASDSG